MTPIQNRDRFSRLLGRVFLLAYSVLQTKWGKPFLAMLFVGLMVGAFFLDRPMNPLFALLVPVLIGMIAFPLKNIDDYLLNQKLLADYALEMARKLELERYVSQDEFKIDWERLTKVIEKERILVWKNGMNWCWDRTVIHKGLIRLESELSYLFNSAFVGKQLTKDHRTQAQMLLDRHYDKYFDIGIKA